MLRLLSEDDLDSVRSDRNRDNKKVMRRFRAERAAIFQGYLRCISRDYGRLLSGLRLMAVQSDTDRPDLARAILGNRMYFAGALCRLDGMVLLYRFGIRGVDVSGLVESLDVLSAQAALWMGSPAAMTV